MSRSVADRIAAKCERRGECLIWTGASSTGRGGKPYGQVHFEGRRRPVHQVAWELANGRRVRPGYQVHHTCEQTLCIEPRHLQETTPRGNLMASDTPARRNARKRRCPEGHPYDEANTYRYPDGRRACRECARARKRQRREAA